jgi:hypothetical protein
MRHRLGIAAALAGAAASACAAFHFQPASPVGACHYRGAGLFVEPDPTCTPGAVSPLVTPANLAATICRPGGYTASVRPPASVTEPQKRRSMAAYANVAPMASVEYDHLVPLSLGGAPNDPRNLWPEPDYPNVSPGSYALNPKDVLEDRLHKLVCEGQVSLRTAQQLAARGWVAAYRRLVR